MLRTKQMESECAMGSMALWGFAPAVDFSLGGKEVGECTFWTKQGSECVSVLFVGVPDLCHIVQNLPEALQQPDRPVNFYVLENSVEVYARQLLLLLLISEPLDSVGLQERVWMYMDIVGNTFVRPSTAAYIQSAAARLIEFVTGSDETLLPWVSLAELKYRERDQLVAVFQFWRSAADSEVDVAQMWDFRLRQHLQQRYDSRQGVFDWDFFMRLKDRLKDEFVQSREYKHWRETGVAFQRPGTEQTCVNRTLLTVRAVGPPGHRRLRRAYWGDLVSGPYTSWGLHTDDQTLRKKQNGRLRADATEVYASNLQILCQGLGDRLCRQSHVRAHFLAVDSGAQLGRRAQFRRRFSAAVFSGGMAHTLTAELSGCLQPRAPVMLETARYLLPVTADQQQLLMDKYAEVAAAAGCLPRLRAGRVAREPEKAGTAELQRAGEKELGIHSRDSQDNGAGKTEEADNNGNGAKHVTDSENNGMAYSQNGDDTEHTSENVTLNFEEIKEETNSCPNDNSSVEAASTTSELTPSGGSTDPRMDDGSKAILSAAGPDSTNRVHDAATPKALPSADAPPEIPKDLTSEQQAGILPSTEASGAGEPVHVTAATENKASADQGKAGSELTHSTANADTSITEPPITSPQQGKAGGSDCGLQPTVRTTSADAVAAADVTSSAAVTSASSESSPTSAAGDKTGRKWTSDKLTALPEWLCFYKVHSDDE